MELRLNQMATSSIVHKLLLLLLLLLDTLAAQSNITCGTTFTPLSNSSWPSPSGNFAFGFTPLETDPALFLLAVWFDKTPRKTVVWTANGDNPVTNRSKAELTPDGRLSLKDHTAQEIWSAGNTYPATHASMLDTGNFVMSGADTGTVWQSFDSPTDTLLPGQVVGQGATIFARLTDDDYSRGRFVLTLEGDGNLVLKPVAYPTAAKHKAYWSTRTPAAGMNHLVFNGTTGSLYISFPNGSTVSVFPAVSGDLYLRATLDPDGAFRQYSYPKLGMGNWTAKSSVGPDICSERFEFGSGSCGFNSDCIVNADGRSNCLCHPHHSFIDPTKKFKGCKPDFTDDVDRKAFIKLSALNNSVEGTTGWKTREIAISISLCGSVALNIIMISSCCFVYQRSRRPLPSNSSRMRGSVMCSFTYRELEEATKGFSEEVGKGAFGTVYKGVLPSEPRTLIAVKRLGDPSLLEKAEKDFANEVTAIGQTHHKNLVRLLGFCNEGVHRLLVFEFMSNGPLNRYIFGDDKPEWTERVQIAIGIAEGLAYLHESCGSQIIHCDIKPHNILLDSNYVANISDFGMAKLLPLKQTQTRTFVRGTIGYFAPEWFKNGAITAKVDVYSFGVMLLEIICCRTSFECGSVRSDGQEVTLLDHAKECYRNRRLDSVVVEDAMEDGMRLERLLLVAISCIQDEPWLRPSMKKVVQMLEGTVPVSIP